MAHTVHPGLGAGMAFGSSSGAKKTYINIPRPNLLTLGGGVYVRVCACVCVRVCCLGEVTWRRWFEEEQGEKMRSSVDWKKKSMRRSERNDGGGGGNNMEVVGVGRGGAMGIVCGRRRTDDGREEGGNGTRAAVDGVIYVERNEAGRDARAGTEVKLLQLPAGNMLHQQSGRGSYRT